MCMLEGGVDDSGKHVVLRQNRVEIGFRFLSVQDRKRLHGESEVLVMEDREDLEVMRRVMRYIFRTSVRKDANTGEGGIPLTAADVLNVVCSSTNKYMDCIHLLQGSLVKSDAKQILCCYQRDSILRI